ncbi:outer membrane protein assembly factor BamB family protein [Nocardia sp. IFM 10818]
MKRVWAVAAAVGAGLIVGGACLAVYSRFFASTVALENVWVGCASNEIKSCGAEASGVADSFATAAVVLGGLLLTTVALIGVRLVRRWETSRGTILLVAAAVLGCLLVLPDMAFNNRLPEAYQQIRFEYPWFERLPTAVAACLLLVVGTMLGVRVGVQPERMRDLRTWVVALSSVVGLLISAGIAATSITAGDDRRNIDHVTASAVGPAAVPDRLGTEKYRLSLPSSGAFVAAGAGFVSATWEGLTGYDGASGEPRWHYRRTGAEHDGEYGITLSAETLRARDDGRVVLAEWSRGGWTALDATTGELLWQTSDFSRDLGERDDRRYRHVPSIAPSRGPLVLASEDRIAGYDARTGARQWSTETSVPDCWGTMQRVTVTDRAVYRVDDCANDTEFWIQATILDPRTGARIGSRELGRSARPADRGSRSTTLTGYGNSVGIDWDWEGQTGMVTLGAPEQLATARVTARSGYSVKTADPNGQDAIVRDPTVPPADPGRYTVVSLETGAVKYPLPGMEGALYDSMFLSAEVVEQALYLGPDGDARPEVRAWSRADGSLVQSIPYDHPDQVCDESWLMAAPGAVLVACSGKKKVELIGFASSP